MEKGQVKWYAHPIGDVVHANEVIAMRLHEFAIVEPAKSEMLCADGKERNLWEMPNYETLKKFWDAQRALQFQIEMFIAKGVQAPARWKLGELKKKHHMKDARRFRMRTRGK